MIQSAADIWRQANAERPATERIVRAAAREAGHKVAGEVLTVDLAALLDQAYAAMTRLVERMGQTEYHAGLSTEQRETLKTAIREVMSALRDVLAAL